MVISLMLKNLLLICRILLLFASACLIFVCALSFIIFHCIDIIMYVWTFCLANYSIIQFRGIETHFHSKWRVFTFMFKQFKRFLKKLLLKKAKQKNMHKS